MKAWFGWVGIGAGLAIAGASITAVKLRNERPIVVVNGEKISRSRFLAELEEAQGANVLRRMIQEKLVLQQAAKKGLMPTPAQIQAEIAELRQSDPDMDRQLRLSGKTEADLEHDVQGRLATARLIAADVKLSDQEAKQLWATHQKQFNRPEGRKLSMILAKTSDIAEKARRSMAAGASAEFAAQSPGMALPGGRSQIIAYRGQLPPRLEKQVFAMRIGEVSSVLQLGRMFAVVKVIDQIPAQQKSFDQVKDRLELALKVRKGKSQPELIQSLQKEARIDFQSDRYKGLADTALAAPLPRPVRVARSK
jgi:parvulin-like peptidyl-prolyl isomerase